MKLLSVFLLSLLYTLCHADTITVTSNTLDYRQFVWIDTQISMMITYEMEVYRSTDEGQTWTKINDQLEGSDDSTPGWIYPNTANTSKIYIRGDGEVCWTSIDKGATWTTANPTREYINLAWHPFQSDWALAQPRYSYDLYLTKDFGQTWELVLRNVYQYSWGDAGVGTIPIERIYFIVESDEEGPYGGNYLEFSYTEDYGDNLLQSLGRAYVFLFLEKQLFVLTYVESNQEFILKVTPDLGSRIRKFYDAEFPFGDELPNNGYQILDDSTGAVFMGVNHGSSSSHWGNLYISNSIGNRYISSLQHMSQFYGIFDFGRVQGLEGIYIANVVDNWQDPGPDKSSDHLITFMSWDNGDTWKQLKPPHYDSQGNPISCSGRCALHLHGWSSYYQNFGPFYSSPNAIGLILATGNVGDHLSFERDNVNTYLSRDAGLTWKELRKGVSIYEFADHGGIIVLADLGAPTTTLYYTLDEGTTPLQSIEISTTPMDVNNIIIEPSTVGRAFILLGTKDNQGVIMGLDFSSIQERECESSDYELWEAQTPEHHCILGKNTTYARRKPDAECFNPRDTDHIMTIEYCVCTEEDWECDFGYERGSSNDTAPCTPISDVEETYPPEYCPAGEKYYKTNGYRLEAGNQCVGGVNHAPEGPFDCPSEKSGSKAWIAAVVIVPIVVILVIFGIVALRSEKVREKLPFLKFANTWRSGYVGMQNVDDEEGGLIDQEEKKHDHEEAPPKKPAEEEEMFNPRA